MRDEGAKRQREAAKLSPSLRESAARPASELNNLPAPPRKKARQPSPPAARSSKSARPRDEFDFIESVRLRADENFKGRGRTSSSIPRFSFLLTGIGDDAAVFRPGARRDTVVTADLLVEDVDFRRATFEPAALGHKALAVSLSDIAAMGARPRWALLSVGVPNKIWRGSFLDEFYEGFFRLAREHNVTLVGGDVSRTPDKIVVDSIVLGEVACGRAVPRSGARPGDQIFVTGSLGGAAAGLRLIEQSDRPRLTAAERRKFSHGAADLFERQRRPTPRVEWGAHVGERGLATAMIDLSDGLSSDLAHLRRESRVGALIHADALPINRLLTDRRALRRNPLADELRRSALAYATGGGEDFELLFTVRPADVAKLPRELGGVPATRVGEIRESRFGARIVAEGRERVLRPAGFKHFAGGRR